MRLGRVGKYYSAWFIAALLSGVAAGHAATITKTRIAPLQGDMNARRGTLWATIDGKEQALAAQVWHAWIIEGGHTLLWAGSDGAGGFENEGQSLWRYDATTGRRRKLMNEDYEIHQAQVVRTRAGRTVVVVSLEDSGLGGPHVAVADLRRGEVWRHALARVAGIRHNRLAIALLREADIEASDGAHNNTLRPRRMMYLNLDALLRRPVLQRRTRH